MNERAPLMAGDGEIATEFALDDGIVFMNAASKSVLPRGTVAAGEAGAAAKGRPWAIDEPGRDVQAEDIRARFAALIGATGDDIAIHPAVSYGIATAARNLAPAPGSRIVTLDGQFPSNVYAWRRLAETCGAEVAVVARPDDGDWTTAVLSEIDARTSIAALPPCHWVDGTLIDLHKVGAAVKEFGAAFVVDATQWVGAQPIDVAAIGADFLVCAAYKWLLGPYGLSFFYAAPKHHQGRPLEEHLFNHGGVASITNGLDYDDAFTKGARRFDAGEYLNLISLPMIQASLIRIGEWQPARIGRALAPITEAIATGGRDLGFDVAGADKRSPHIVALGRQGDLPADTAARLQERGLHVSTRGGFLRFSPYLFNGMDDAARALNILESAFRD